MEKRHIRHDESNFQIGVVNHLRWAGFYVFAVPNGQRLNLLRAKLAVREGLMSGVSDLILLLPGKVYFIEIKNPNGKGRQSPAQREFEDTVRAYGHKYLLWDSWNQVEQFVKDHKQEVGNYLEVGGTDAEK